MSWILRYPAVAYGFFENYLLIDMKMNFQPFLVYLSTLRFKTIIAIYYKETYFNDIAIQEI